MGRPKVTERKKNKKKSNTEYIDIVYKGNNINHMVNELIPHFSILKKSGYIFPSEIVKRYRNILLEFNIKPMKNKLDYLRLINCNQLDNIKEYCIAKEFIINHKDYFDDAVMIIISKLSHKINEDLPSMALMMSVNLWLALDFAVCQLNEQESVNK